MTDAISVLIAGDDEDLINHLEKVLKEQPNYQTRSIRTGGQPKPSNKTSCDIALLAVHSCNDLCAKISEAANRTCSGIPFIVITFEPAPELALEVMRTGAQDLLHLPLDLQQLESSIKRVSKNYQTLKVFRELEGELDTLRREIAEKEILLKEIHHRVRNNLMVVSSLLSIGASHVDDEQAVQMFRECQNRIFVMARIHQHLYQSEGLSHVEMQEYLPFLVNRVRYSFGAHHVTLDINIADATLPMKIAVLCGLIVNELVTNALKHAFPEGELPQDQTARIAVTLTTGAKTWELVVTDNGIGLPAIMTKDDEESLGMELVEVLVKQLGGSLQVKSGEKQGTTFTISFSPTCL